MKACNQSDIDKHYRSIYNQSGHGYPIIPFQGSRYQKGHELGSIFSKLLPFVKKIAKPIGKSLLRTGLNIAKDTIEGQPIKQSIKSNFKKTGGELATSSIKALLNKTPPTNKRNRPSKKSFSTKKARRAKRSKSKDIFGN